MKKETQINFWYILFALMAVVFIRDLARSLQTDIIGGPDAVAKFPVPD